MLIPKEWHRSDCHKVSLHLINCHHNKRIWTALLKQLYKENEKPRSSITQHGLIITEKDRKYHITFSVKTVANNGRCD